MRESPEPGLEHDPAREGSTGVSLLRVAAIVLAGALGAGALIGLMALFDSLTRA